MTIEKILKRELKGHLPSIKTMEKGHLHKMVMGLVEKSLLEIVLENVEGNQTNAANILGINRNTLRKKIADYQLGR